MPSSSQQDSPPDSSESAEMVIESGAPTQAQDDKLMEDGSPAQGDGDTPMENEPNAQTGGELPPTEGGSPSSEYPEDLAEDIRAAQEALEQAGIAIQAAGVALETAETDAELAEAEKSLARARVSVIIAGQDLMDISDIFEGTPEEGTILDAEEALNEANVAIVIATDSIFDSRIQLPDFGQLKGETRRERERETESQGLNPVNRPIRGKVERRHLTQATETVMVAVNLTKHSTSLLPYLKAKFWVHEMKYWAVHHRRHPLKMYQELQYWVAKDWSRDREHLKRTRMNGLSQESPTS